MHTQITKFVSPTPLAHSNLHALQADMCLVLRLEEVLPRPAAGLLHRMLRLAPVEVEQRGSHAEPGLLVHADTSYQLSVAAYQVSFLLPPQQHLPTSADRRHLSSRT